MATHPNNAHPNNAPRPPPPAPHLSGEARLLVFVHHSVPNPPLQEPYGDNRRLAALGKPCLKSAYMAAVASTRLDLRGAELEQYVNDNMAAFVDRWVGVYDWRRQLYGVPQGTNLHDPEETRRIFDTFAGAVVAQNNLGLQALLLWIDALVRSP